MATETQESAKLAQLAHENPDEIEVAAGREREQLEGWIPALASDAEIREALEKAFDYRGDITITRKDGSQIVGYLFDRRDRLVSGRLVCSHHPVERADQGERCLLRYRGACVYRPGYGGRQDLRGLGEEVLGEEGGRREEYPDRAREAGLKGRWHYGTSHHSGLRLHCASRRRLHGA